MFCRVNRVIRRDEPYTIVQSYLQSDNTVALVQAVLLRVMEARTGAASVPLRVAYPVGHNVPPGLADLRAQRDVTLRRECGFELRVGGRCRLPAGGDANPGWPPAEAQRDGRPALATVAGPH